MAVGKDAPKNRLKTAASSRRIRPVHLITGVKIVSYIYLKSHGHRGFQNRPGIPSPKNRGIFCRQESSYRNRNQGRVERLWTGSNKEEILIQKRIPSLNRNAPCSVIADFRLFCGTDKRADTFSLFTNREVNCNINTETERLTLHHIGCGARPST